MMMMIDRQICLPVCCTESLGIIFGLSEKCVYSCVHVRALPLELNE